MIKNGIKLLVVLALTTVAVGAGFTHAFSDSDTIGGSTSIVSMSDPGATVLSGEPDPGSAPVPKSIASREYYSTRHMPSWLSWAGRVWAAWYLRTSW